MDRSLRGGSYFKRNRGSGHPSSHDPRPHEQDIRYIQITVNRVVIHDLKENTFYANLYLNVEGEELIVDSRPSDAIALAVRVKAPIFVAETVIERQNRWGFSPLIFREGDELKTIIENMSQKISEI